jgi:branched-chain amino acid transport system ATP-binding protein
MLQVDGVSVAYGAIAAVRDVSLTVGEGELVALVGANGAGKTSLLRCISGLKPSASGSLTFLGRDITRVAAEKIVRRGLCHVPEGRHVFPMMSVVENLHIANWGSHTSLKAELDRVYDLFPILRDRSNQLAYTLSGGEQQMLAIARALVRRPRMLMLDEPSMGLAPIVMRQVFQLIRRIHEEGTAVLLVEQNARMALDIADRAYLLESGAVTASGPAAELLNEDDLRAAYLGK